MSEVSTDKKLKGKDLITIGIFSAIYFVINFAFMLLGGIHPVLWMLMPGFIAVFAGIPFMLMVAKVQKLGAVFLMGLITALIYFVTGQFTLVILISMASTCILAEVVRAVTKYNSFKGNSIAYVIFSLGMVGSPLPIWLFKADFLAQITRNENAVENRLASISPCSRTTAAFFEISLPCQFGARWPCGTFGPVHVSKKGGLLPEGPPLFILFSCFSTRYTKII